jgi:prepilin-type N-terminal cleavage/methylation domain-containing protein
MVSLLTIFTIYTIQFQEEHPMQKLFAKNKESGFTLIEMVTVILIIGILTAIAIPVYLNQRKEAWKDAVREDITNTVVVVERNKSLSGDYVASVSAPPGVTLSSNVSLKVSVLPAASGDTACVEAFNTLSPSDTLFHYNISQRTLLSGGC